MARLIYCLAPLALVSLFACRSTSRALLTSENGPSVSGTVQFDVNDASILLPTPKSIDDIANYLRLDAVASGGPFLSQVWFDELVGYTDFATDPQFSNFKSVTTWLIVAMRFDPCVKELPSSTGCRAEFRLSAQPYVIRAGQVHVEDNAIHLIHAVDSGESKVIIKELIQLKRSSSSVSTNGVPLGEHPVIAAEGMAGPFAEKFKELVLKYSGQNRLADVAAMFTVLAANWRFVKGTVESGKLKQLTIPCLNSKTATMFGSTGFVGNFFQQAQPDSTCAKNVNRIIDSNHRDDLPFKRGSFFKLSPAEQAKDTAIALGLNNPETVTFNSVDCVSCHMASRSVAKVKSIAYLTAADGDSLRFPVPPGITSTYAADEGDSTGAYSVRAFGRGFAEAKVSYVLFTLNDAMRVAARLNRMIASGDLD